MLQFPLPPALPATGNASNATREQKTQAQHVNLTTHDWRHWIFTTKKMCDDAVGLPRRSRRKFEA
jgi:hypothetical protein